MLDHRIDIQGRKLARRLQATITCGRGFDAALRQRDLARLKIMPAPQEALLSIAHIMVPLAKIRTPACILQGAGHKAADVLTAVPEKDMQ